MLLAMCQISQCANIEDSGCHHSPDVTPPAYRPPLATHSSAVEFHRSETHWPLTLASHRCEVCSDSMSISGCHRCINANTSRLIPISAYVTTGADAPRYSGRPF